MLASINGRVGTMFPKQKKKKKKKVGVLASPGFFTKWSDNVKETMMSW